MGTGLFRCSVATVKDPTAKGGGGHLASVMLRRPAPDDVPTKAPDVMHVMGGVRVPPDLPGPARRRCHLPVFGDLAEMIGEERI